MAADSTWGIPKPVRTVLAARVAELRVGLQEDARRQLAALGITGETVGPPPGGRTLSSDEERSREVVLAVLAARREAGVPREEALQGYVEEVAFTLLDRLVAFRCLEERGLLLVDGQVETLVKRDPVRGTSSLVWRTRAADPGLDERSVARSAYRAACAAMTERVRVLFDPDDEPSALFPTLPLWQRATDALNDPAIPPATFAQDEVMGWVYQYWSTQLKDAVYDKLAHGGKIEDPKELAAATCLYTERYIVDYLVQNTLGATWVAMHPESTLPATWPYYVRPPTGNPPATREPRPVREITLLDPACGSGHFLVRPFELFAQLYAEEGTEDPAEVPALILEHNLHGIDIDRRAVQIAALALYLKGCTAAGPDFRPRKLNLVAADIVLPPDPPADFIAKFEDRDLADIAKSLWAGLQGIREFGSLLHPERTVNDAFRRLRARDRDGLWAKDEAAWAKRRTQLITELRRAVRRETGETDLGRHLFGAEAARGLDLLQVLGRHYDVVVANPPYLIAGSLDSRLKSWLSREFADARRDLYAAFMKRCVELLNVHGNAGLVTRDSWMFGKRFAEFRRSLLTSAHLASLAHLGTGAFEEVGGAVVSVAATVMRNRLDDGMTRFHQQTDVQPSSAKAVGLVEVAGGRAAGRTYMRRQEDFLALLHSPLVYWLPPWFLERMKSGPYLRSLAPAMEGLHTGDDDRFLRFFWEVDPPVNHAWVPYAKGGGYARWRGLEWYVVAWAESGRDIKASGGAIIPSEGEYFRRCLGYTDFASGSLGVRELSSEFIFGDKGPAIRAGEDNAALAGLLNSRVPSFLLRALCPSMQFRTGYVNSLPLPDRREIKTATTAGPAIALKTLSIEARPTERAFVRVVVEKGVGLGDAEALIHALEGWNERLAFDAYEVDDTNVQFVLARTGTPAGWHPSSPATTPCPSRPKESRSRRD